MVSGLGSRYSCGATSMGARCIPFGTILALQCWRSWWGWVPHNVPLCSQHPIACILDIEFVITDGEWPTKHNSRPMKDDQFGRGSIVFFNQATMLQSSESGFMTLKQAAAAGAPTTSNYDEVVEKCFLALAALRLTQNWEVTKSWWEFVYMPGMKCMQLHSSMKGASHHYHYPLKYLWVHCLTYNRYYSSY